MEKSNLVVLTIDSQGKEEVFIQDSLAKNMNTSSLWEDPRQSGSSGKITEDTQKKYKQLGSWGGYCTCPSGVILLAANKNANFKGVDQGVETEYRCGSAF